MPPPTSPMNSPKSHSRKRSHEEMTIKPIRDSRKTPQGSPHSSVLHEEPDEVSQVGEKTPPSARPKSVPHSPAMKTPERPKSRKGDQRDIREINRDTTDDATVQELEDFDWEDFETRYHEAIKKQDEAQKKLYEDFRNLLRFFSNWVNCAVEHENRRSLKRLKTRMAYVQNAEDGLKERREHYTKVVQAFESALALLGT